MKNIKNNMYKIVLLAISTFPVFVSAQTTTTGGGNCNQCRADGTSETAGTICNPINLCSIVDLIRRILEGVIKIGIPVAALAIVYSGYLFVAARGNSEKLTTAKKSLMYTLIGTAVLLGSWAIAKLISETVLAL